MSRVRRALLHGLMQVGWALLLIYLILAVTGCLVGQYIGFQDAYVVCSAIALLVTVAFAVIFACDAARIAFEWKKDRHQQH